MTSLVHPRLKDTLDGAHQKRSFVAYTDAKQADENDDGAHLHRRPLSKDHSM